MCERSLGLASDHGQVRKLLRSLHSGMSVIGETATFVLATRNDRNALLNGLRVGTILSKPRVDGSGSVLDVKSGCYCSTTDVRGFGWTRIWRRERTCGLTVSVRRITLYFARLRGRLWATWLGRRAGLSHLWSYLDRCVSVSVNDSRRFCPGGRGAHVPAIG